MLLKECNLVNDDEQVVCTLSWDVNKDLKQYGADIVVLRTSIKDCTIMQVADVIVGNIYNNPKNEELDGSTVHKFAFPLYGAATIKIVFTGVEMSDYIYFTLKYQVALMICSIVTNFWKTAFKRAESQDEINSRIDAITRKINEEYLVSAEAYSNGDDIPPLAFLDDSKFVTV